MKLLCAWKRYNENCNLILDVYMHYNCAVAYINVLVKNL